MIPLLTEPEQGEQAFHVVIPSQPGFAFSAPPPSDKWRMEDTARVFDTLMTGLGYEQYAAQGGDWVCLSPALALSLAIHQLTRPTLDDPGIDHRSNYGSDPSRSLQSGPSQLLSRTTLTVPSRLYSDAILD